MKTWQRPLTHWREERHKWSTPLFKNYLNKAVSGFELRYLTQLSRETTSKSFQKNGQPRRLFHLFSSFRTNLVANRIRTWIVGRWRWPLAQHVPTTSISLDKVAIKSSTWWMILVSLQVICLFRSRANLFQVSFGRNGSSGSGSSIQKNASGCFLKFLNCIWLTSFGETLFCTTYHRPLLHWICKIPCISTRWARFLNCPRTKL